MWCENVHIVLQTTHNYSVDFLEMGGAKKVDYMQPSNVETQSC